MSAELATIETAPALQPVSAAHLVGVAKDAAKHCREIVKACSVTIQGRRYITVEGWQSIAAAFGCALSVGSVETVEGGICAKGRVIRASDGAIIAEAEGFLGEDEKLWLGRPMYARRAMAQTRAMSRAGRSAFAFVAILMAGNFATTPAEEMESDAAPARPTRRAAAAPAPETYHEHEADVPRPLFGSTKGGRK